MAGASAGLKRLTLELGKLDCFSLNFKSDSWTRTKHRRQGPRHRFAWCWPVKDNPVSPVNFSAWQTKLTI
jgi:hypothetical protein